MLLEPFLKPQEYTMNESLKATEKPDLKHKRQNIRLNITKHTSSHHNLQKTGKHDDNDISNICAINLNQNELI